MNLVKDMSEEVSEAGLSKLRTAPKANPQVFDDNSYDEIMKKLVETGVQKAQMTGDAKYLDYAKELN